VNIYEKLIEVRKAVPYLQKEAKGHQYNYVSSSQVLSAVRRRMDEVGLMLIPTITNTKVTSENDGKRTTYFTELWIDFTWVNAEKPDELWKSSWYGQGIDIAGEKGVGKALTYAEKYYLLKTFNIATDKDDPDSFQDKQEGTNGRREPRNSTSANKPPARQTEEKPAEKPPTRQNTTGDDSKPNWTAFWTVVRPLNLTKEFINQEASAFFNCSINKSLTEVPDLDNALLQQFAEYLTEMQRKGA
jgi:hypothetical protein